MAIELRQTVKLSQQLVMTPQLQQAIKLLQLNRLELSTLIQQELQENPVLEEVEAVDEDRASLEATREAETPDVSPADSGEAAENREPTDAEKVADVDWQDYIDSRPQTSFNQAAGDDEERAFDATLSKRESLADHLEWQIHLSDFDEQEVEVSNWIVGNLDPNGYLKASNLEIARSAGVEEEMVASVLRKVHQLDPPGIAARTLRECLMMQLPSSGMGDPLVYKVIDQYLDALQRKDFRSIARSLDTSVEEIASVARDIAQLDPRPGRAYTEDEPVYITPDIYVYKVGDEFHIVLNEDGMPKLRMSNFYRDLLGKEKDTSADTKEYVQDKVRSALWLIKSIHQRQRTIYKVVKSLIRFQRDFFEKGVQYLVPLNLRDVAEDIDMHESTVSRVTTNKYVHTPQGVFELKYFFNSSIGRFNGEAIASESVKEKIRRIITNEDSRRPLSDQRIAEMLKVANIDIARRTVTKYRESMNLLSSTKRRIVG